MVILRWQPTAVPTARHTWQPAIELQDRRDALTLRVQLPGLSADDLEVEASRDAIRIRGDRPARDGVTYSEFRTGRFERALALPAAIRPEDIEAEFQAGVLVLTLPKWERPQPVRVAIATAAAQPTAAPEPEPAAVNAVIPKPAPQAAAETSNDGVADSIADPWAGDPVAAAV